MTKKILALLMLSILTFSLWACGNGERKEVTVVGDFSLEIVVSKNKLSVEDTITMTLKNLSGKDIPIRTLNQDTVDLNHMLVLFVMPGLEDIGINLQEDELGNELLFEKDAVIQRIIKLADASWVLYESLGKRRLIAQAGFFMGDNFNERIYLSTKEFQIKVVEV